MSFKLCPYCGQPFGSPVPPRYKYCSWCGGELPTGEPFYQVWKPIKVYYPDLRE